MLNDWFAECQLEMPWESFLRLPRHPAYRYEYRAGHVTISGHPRYRHCVLKLGGDSKAERREPGAGPDRNTPLASGESQLPADVNELRLIQDQDWTELANLFAEAFAQVPPLAQLPQDQRQTAAAALLERTRAGKDGPLVSSASWIIADSESPKIRGAMLITLVPAGSLVDFSDPAWSENAPHNAVESGWGQPHLTWVFVSPARQRRGVASRLLAASIRELAQLGYSHLASTFLMGDHASMLWHWGRGFQLLPRPGSMP